MSTYQCPKGHASTESDYCSECGAKIDGTPEMRLMLRQTLTAAIKCPDCATPFESDSGDFCEICGYNFVTGVSGEVPPVEVRQMIADAIAPTLGGESINLNNYSPASNSQIQIIVTIDPSLRTEGSPEPPINQPPIKIRLDKQSNLIGRRSEIRGIYPEISLDFDDAVSHRHALINREPDGTFILRDIGSTNGTNLNGVELQPMVDTPIKDGDEFTLGHWTRIQVKQITN